MKAAIVHCGRPSAFHQRLRDEYLWERMREMRVEVRRIERTNSIFMGLMFLT